MMEKVRFEACDRPRAAAAGPSDDPRHVSAQVKREVWKRDGGQCTFVSEKGKRCESRTRLEFDHVDAIARGGQSTVRGLRLRCRAHNQYAADCTFGAEFMDGKREESQRRAGETKLRAEARAGAPARVAAP
jgi:hypothetical protein